MKVFVVHRSKDRKSAKKFVAAIGAKNGLFLEPILLKNSFGDRWKTVALSEIRGCEAVILYDMISCLGSENTQWEINRAREMNKTLIIINPGTPEASEISQLISLYNDDKEFNGYFKEGVEDKQTLYKMMVDSSEKLVERRQKLNAFFTTAIGSLVAITTAFASFGTIKSVTLSFLATATFGVTGLLLCNSWFHLIDNYGKLNKAKFRVIRQLEKSLTAQIFSAEWVALGNGRRPAKYQSFTSTENSVPRWFALLIAVFVLAACVLYVLEQSP